MVVQMKKIAVSEAAIRKSVERDASDEKYVEHFRQSVQQARAYVEMLKSQKAK